jgi:signal transduction histidine kinase
MRRPSRRRRVSVRVRLTAVATALTAVAVIGAGGLLLRSVRNTQLAEVRDLAEQSVSLAADRLAAGATYDDALADLAAAVFVTDGNGGCFTRLDGAAGAVQCGFGSGGGRSPNTPATPSRSTATQAAAGPTQPAIGSVTPEPLPSAAGGNEPAEATSQVVDSPRYGRLEVSSPTPAEQVARSTASVRRVLWYFLPILLAAVAAASWLLAGRALRPVELIRREAEAISGSSIHRRLPEPGGGDEIGRLAQTMNAMLDRLDRSSRHQRQFISDASHELRSPIAAIRADLEVALAEGPDADWPAVGRAVLREGMRIEALVADLLLLASDDERARDPGETTEITNVEVILVEEAGRTRPKPVHVVYDPADGPFLVRIASGRLQRALANLLDNAARYAETSIATHLAREHDDVIVHVDDDGPGVPLADRARIFERFARIDDGRARDDGGSGLGLAVVHSIVERAHGTIACSTGPRGGARFTLSLPAASPAGATTQPATSAASS